MSMTFPAMASINGAPEVPAEFEIEQAWIDASTFTARKPDMSWTFVDTAGHFHAFDHEGKLPTVVYREERIEFAGDPSELSEEWDDYIERDDTITHIECGLCGEEIKPQYVPDNPHKVIPGLVDYRLTVQADVPAGRFSVTLTTPDQVWFGFGDGANARREDLGVIVSTAQLGPMSWRKSSAA